MQKKAFLVVAAASVLCVACGRGEIKGDYEVQLEIAGVGQPLDGTLILSTLPLDVPSRRQEETGIDPNWFGGNAIAPNSCFILGSPPAQGPEEQATPGVVRVFEARIDARGIATPIQIVNTSDLTIEINELQFFAGSLGGELEVRTDQGSRPGRISGRRKGSPSPGRCIESLMTFRTYLQDISQANGID